MRLPPLTLGQGREFPSRGATRTLALDTQQPTYSGCIGPDPTELSSDPLGVESFATTPACTDRRLSVVVGELLSPSTG